MDLRANWEPKIRYQPLFWCMLSPEGIFGKTFILTLSPSVSFFYKTVSLISFNMFYLGEKRLLLDLMSKWGWFHGHVCFPKNLGARLKSQKTETCFCRWKSNYYNDINIFLSLENPFTFLLVKEETWKCIFKTNY